MITPLRYIVAGSVLALLNLPSAPDLSTRRAELRRAHDALIARAAAGDFVGAISDAIAPEGFYGAAVSTAGTGPAATRAFLERDSLNGKSRALVVIVRLDVSADGNDGYSYGYLDVIRPNGDTLPGAFKAYWRRGRDGQWRTLCFGRGRRAPGPLTQLPDSLTPRATEYKSWPMRDTVEAWASLRATEVAFSDSSATSIMAAFMSFAAPDAGKIDGSGYVFGREAIGREYLTPPPGFAGIAWHAERGTVAGSNDLGFNFGPVTERNGASRPSSGGFFTIWRRQPNGEWKYLVD